MGQVLRRFKNACTTVDTAAVIDPPAFTQTTISTFKNKYKLGKLLGKGSFGFVHLCTKRDTEETFAVKIIDISDLTKNLGDYGLKSLEKEVEAMRKLNHPHIVKLYDSYEEVDFFYMVIEYLPGGDLLKRITEKIFVYSEIEARSIMKILIETIKYCHDNNYVHRDLKPENLLLVSETDDINLKIGDFGFVNQDAETRCLETFGGTLLYQAPEILSRMPYNRSCDMWSIGVLCFLLLRRKLPFQGESERQVQLKILHAQYEFDCEWNSISLSAKDFVMKLLVPNPKERLTAENALKHPWFKDAAVENSVFSVDKFTNQERIQVEIETN